MCKFSIRKLVAVLAVGVLLCVTTASAMIIEPLRFEQYAFRDLETLQSSPPTYIGGCVVDFEPDPAEGFLNVAVFIPGLSTEPMWVVRNLRIHEATGGVPFETITCTFPMDELGIENGMPISDIQYSYEVLPTPLLIADSALWLASQPVDRIEPVMQVVNDVGQGIPEVDDELEDATPDVWFSTTDAAGVDTVYSNIGCYMPNIDLGGTGDANDVNGCMPASCANSLEWLKKLYPDITFPHSSRSVMNQLGRLAGRTGPQGVWAADIAKAKLDFIEAHKLPIHVKIQSNRHEGDIKSSSGHTKCDDKDGAANQWPTRDFIMSEAKKGEDVEVCVTWYYLDATSGKWVSVGAHALVLTGARVTAGVYKIKLKDDRYQGEPGGLRERPSDVINVGTAVEIPGLKYVIPSGKPGAGQTARPFVSAVVSESRDTTVTHPGDTETVSKYCQYIKRTVPKGGSITFTFPDTGSTRCYNGTVVLREPAGQYGHDIGLGQWNLNRGKSRTYTNNHNKPVVIMLHNDDKAGGQTPYPGFDVGISISTPDSTSKAATGEVDPFNPQEYGGFSLGGSDNSSEGYSQTYLGTSVMVGPMLENLDLAQVPARIAEFSPGTRDLHLMADSAAWNIYWEHLGFVLDVLEVTTPGDLFVECPVNGFMATIPIVVPGRYELNLGMMPMTPNFELILHAQNNLDMIIDSIGVPSLVAVDVSDVPSIEPNGVYLSAADPNPFNPRTRFRYGLTETGRVDIAVFDVRGHRVATLLNEVMAAGDHQVYWDGRGDNGLLAASGTYVCRLVAGTQVRTTRMMLLK